MNTINTSVRNQNYRLFGQNGAWHGHLPIRNRTVAGTDTLLDGLVHGGCKAREIMAWSIEDPRTVCIHNIAA